ncbi:TPA: hypothetical protein KD105_003043 [Vibrio parahaemolyticus]|uniref:hypothetical protein n=1 Tax=Vibrio parahaemolyticus TaxID=670 RepID=UPI001B826473|nr:hypothetical protein [Vibrio parahaemolyticus]ELB7607252.1 hypothetical protein [Vibrio parahaemolyticus]HBC3605750.1 hypothetical protein [Vibrio parahaemolyticus]
MDGNIKKIMDLCDQNDVEYELDEKDEISRLILKIKRERSYTELYIRSGRIAEQFAKDDFYKYRFVSGYEAIWSSELGIVECQIDCPRDTGLWERILARHIGIEDLGSIRNREFEIVLKDDEKCKIEISSASETFADFYSFQQPRRIRIRKVYPTTLKVSGLNLKKHGEALKVVRELMSSVCFQLDEVTGLPLQLISEQKPIGKRHNGYTEDCIVIPSFDYKYDVEALSLYWNARSLIGMPLGQYLAYYQTIEFYYTVYSNRDAQLRIKNLLKDPKFDVSKDKDLSKILNIVKYNANSNAFGNELEQLKATLKHCIDIEEVEGFFTEQEFGKDTFSNQKIKKLASQAINMQFEDSDVLYSEIAKRIYEIRCRIVHTKGVQDNVETLHPLSNETKHISPDLKLIEFIAKRILIANSQPINA